VSSSPIRVRSRPPTAPNKETAQVATRPEGNEVERRRRVFADALERFDEKNSRILAELAK
jgi:arylsulfatase A-like enzyme